MVSCLSGNINFFYMTCQNKSTASDETRTTCENSSKEILGSNRISNFLGRHGSLPKKNLSGIALSTFARPVLFFSWFFHFSFGYLSKPVPSLFESIVLSYLIFVFFIQSMAKVCIQNGFRNFLAGNIPRELDRSPHHTSADAAHIASF